MSKIDIGQLEQAALAAHRAGQTSATFWADHAEQVRQAERYHRSRFRRLVRRLPHLLCSGAESVQRPAGAGLVGADATKSGIFDWKLASSG